MKKSTIFLSLPFLLSVNLFLVILSQKSIAQLPTWLWAKDFGNNQSDYGRGITMDDSGNIYTIGSFSGNIAFDNIQLSSSGGQNIYVTKMNPQGHILWAKQAKGNWADHSLNITVDKNENVFISGSFLSDSLTLDSFAITNTSAGSEEIFIAKLNSDGTPLWLKKASGSYRDFPGGIKADPFGNIVVTGFYESTTISFDGFTLIKSPGWRSIYFVKYDTNGNVLWAKSFGGDWWDLGESISFDNTGNIYLGGGFGSSSITFGTIKLTKASSVTFDLFIGKFTPDGDAIWVRSASGNGSEDAANTVVDQDGNVYIASYSSSTTIDFNTIILSTNDGGDALLAKYDPNGNIQWAKLIGGTGQELGQGITIDNNTHKIIVSGNYNSPSLSFGSKILSNQGLNDIFIAEYDFSGNFIDAVNAGGADDDSSAGIVGNEKLGFTLTGTFKSDTLKFGTNVIINHNAGTEDVFIAKMYSLSFACGNVPSNGLVAYYPFNGNASDASGNGHDGTIYGSVTPTTDRFGKAASAYSWPTDGSPNNYIDIGYLQNSIPNSITISAWILMDGGVYDSRVISSGEQGIICNGASNNTYRTFKASYNAAGAIIWPSTHQVSALQWHHLVYTADHNTLKARFYIDGVLVDTSSGPIKEDLATDVWNIGRKSIAAYDGWGGKIDDISIYNRALDSMEVQQLYHECGYDVTLAKNDIKLSAVSIAKAVKVNWITESEEDIANYTLQRSVDGVHFSDIKLETAKGYKNSSYEYLDNNIPANKNIIYYRIKANNKDDNYKYSAIVKVTLSSLQHITLYPNPAKDRVNITYEALQVNTSAIIVNSYGVIVKRVALNAGSTHSLIDVSALSKGIYFLKIVDNTKQQVLKFVKE